MLFHRKRNKKYKKRRNSSEPVIPQWQTSLRKKDRNIRERAALCTLGSMTVEAAVILPLFLIAMLTLICVIDVCRVYTEKQGELAEKAKQIGTYAYLEDSYLEEGYVDLFLVYPHELPVSLIPGYHLNLALRARVHGWTGRSDYEYSSAKENFAETMVYVTNNQAVYHTNSDCSYLDLSIYAVGKAEVSSKRNKSGGRYGACEKCCSSLSEVSVYYLTENGDRYHSSRECSGLTRHVKMIKESSAAHLSICSRCRGG